MKHIKSVLTHALVMGVTFSSLGAYAAAPVAQWVEDFGEGSLVQGAYTLSFKDGCELDAGKTSFTIGTSDWTTGTHEGYIAKILKTGSTRGDGSTMSGLTVGNGVTIILRYKMPSVTKTPATILSLGDYVSAGNQHSDFAGVTFVSDSGDYAIRSLNAGNSQNGTTPDGAATGLTTDYKLLAFTYKTNYVDGTSGNRIYLDGELVHTYDNAAKRLGNISEIAIGGPNYNWASLREAAGLTVDAIAIFDRALTQEEIQSFQFYAPEDRTRVISYNVAQRAGGAYTEDMGVVTSLCETVAGLIPTNAWVQQASYDYGSNALNLGYGAFTDMVAYNRAAYSNETTTADLNMRLTQTTNISALNGHSALYPFLDANLSQKAGANACAMTLTFTQIPFNCYDVIIYFSAGSGNGTVSGTTFNPISVNGTAVQSAAWGDNTVVDRLVEGTNYVRVAKCSGTTLTITGTETTHFRGVAAVQLVERIPPSYKATISGDTAWSALSWTTNGVPVETPSDLAAANLSIHGSGFVSGLSISPISLALDDGVLCDVTATSGTSFSGYGRFLYRASSLTSAKTFGTEVRYGVIAYDAGGETATGALTINSNPFYSYGHVTLNSATFSTTTASAKNEVYLESGNLTLNSTTAPNRAFRVMPGATLTLGAALTLTSSNCSGFYGNGTFAVAPNITLDGGYVGVDAKAAYSGESVLRQQLIWTDHGTVGAGATLKLHTVTNRIDAGVADFLGRFTIDTNGKIELYALSATMPFAMLPDSTVTTDDYPFESSASVMGYAEAFKDEVKLANVGYDTSFISALAGEAGLAVTNLPAGGTFAASLYADVAGATGREILTLGDPATAALRLVVEDSILNLVAVESGAERVLGLTAARSPGFHLYTVVRSGNATTLYVDGVSRGTDYSVSGTITGAFTVGAGVSLRMGRVDAANLSAGAVQKLAQIWPVIANTTARVSSDWAKRHLPEAVVTPIFRADSKPTEDEIEAYLNALKALAKNKRSYLENYLLGIDPDGEVAKNHAYISEVKFSADPVDFAYTNATVLLEYANPAANSGINVTYRLAARKGAGVTTRDVPVINGEATIKDLCASNRTTTAYKAKTEIAPKLPNVIFVLADDLGYGDVGWTVQNARKASGASCWIETPNMDQMVAEGCQMTAHYAAAPVCAPSRASILTGKDQGHCSLRDNCFDYPILEENTIGTLMKSAGYTTYAIGKWGVGGGGESGLPAVARPLDRGFDHHYGFLDHGAGHTYYHYDGLLNGAYMGVVMDREHRTDTATGIYSTDLFIARAKKNIIDHVATNKVTGVDKPFFMYLAINTIHGSNANYLDSSVPHKEYLHVPGRAYPDANPATTKKYGVGEGADWDWLQTNREDIAARNTWLYPYTESFPLVSNNYTQQATRRYATGITRLDEAMADLKETLVDLGISTNTLVIFTSDNGPAQEYGTNASYFDSNGPFSGVKRDVKEGGMREPTFLWWPGHIPAGSIDDRPSMNSSWYSFLEQLVKSNAPGVMPEDVYTEYTHGSSQAQQVMVRVGDYVGLNTAIGTGKTFDTMNLNVYNVVKDPGQTNDLNATSSTDTYVKETIVPRMRALMKSYHTLWRRSDGVGTGTGPKNWTRPYDTSAN